MFCHAGTDATASTCRFYDDRSIDHAFIFLGQGRQGRDGVGGRRTGFVTGRPVRCGFWSFELFWLVGFMLWRPIWLGGGGRGAFGLRNHEQQPNSKRIAAVSPYARGALNLPIFWCVCGVCFLYTSTNVVDMCMPLSFSSFPWGFHSADQ